jgi:MGT family glycosyltransferase
MTSPELDFAGRAELPANVRYMGPVLGAAANGSWESPWEPGDERPLVVVSLSTTFMDQNDLAGRCVEALAGLPQVRGLVTTGPAIDGARLPAAENVEVADFVPHAAVLPEASLVITHGGMGTVHAALAAGAPILCLPGGRDQNDIAARVVAHGAGLRAGQGASAAKLRRLVSRALADASLADRARRLGSALRAQDGAERAADELEALAGERA